MMLEHLGHPDAARAIVDAIATILVEGPRTPDIGGKAKTVDLGKASPRRFEIVRNDSEFDGTTLGSRKSPSLVSCARQAVRAIPPATTGLSGP